MSLTIRNADLGKSIPIGVLLEILDQHEEFLSDRAAVLESNGWVSGEGYRAATPDEIMGNLSDAAHDLRAAILSELEL